MRSKALLSCAAVIVLACLCLSLLVSAPCFAAAPGPAKDKAARSGKIEEPKILGSIILFADEPVAGLHRLAKARGGSVSASEVAEHKNALKAVREKFKGDLKAKFPNAKVRREYDFVLNGMAVDVMPDQLKKLGKLPYVQAIVPDHQVKACLSDSTSLTQAATLWQRGNTGQGITVAVIDTGIDYNHVDLGGGFGSTFKVKGGHDYENNDADPMDDNGHGTHVAGTVAGTGAGSSGLYRGMAPDARLLAYKVLDEDGYGSDTNVLAGIEASCDPNGDDDPSDAANVINMSLGGAAAESQQIDPFCQALSNAASIGTIPVVAAGNDGRFSDGYGLITFSPAYCNNVITVGASTKDDKIASFSSRGPTPQDGLMKPDLVAPGVDIVAPRAVGTDLYGDGTHIVDDIYYRMSGTSMATPHVAGAVALLLHDRAYTLEQIRQVLSQEAKDIGEDEWTQGGGRLQIADSVDAVSIVSPSAIQFGCYEGNPSSTVTVTINNTSNAGRTYDLGYTMYPYTGVTVTLSTNTITVPANSSGSFTINMTINFDDAGAHALYGMLNISNPAEQIKVPFGKYGPGPDDLWPVDLGEAITSGIGLADMNADDKWDVLVGTESGAVRIFDRTGNPFPGWTVPSTGYAITAPVTAEDIDNDREMEVLAISNGQIHVWNANGSVAQGWPYTGVNSSAAVAMSDLNGDNEMDIFAAGGPGNSVVGLKGDGTALTGWPVTTNGQVLAAPAIENMDGDRDLEVVAVDLAGYVYAWNYDGTPVPGWPKSLGAPIVAPPIFAEIERNNSPEAVRALIVCTETGSLNAWRKDGTPVPGWPQTVTGRVWASPIVSALANGPMGYYPDIGVLTTQGRFYVYRPDGTLAPGSRQITVAIPDSDTSRVQPSPCAWTIENLTTTNVLVPGKIDGKVRSWIYNGDYQIWTNNFYRELNGPLSGSPAVVDTEQVIVDFWNFRDHYVEVIAASTSGRLNLWHEYAIDWPPPQEDVLSPWRMLGHDPWHSGRWEGLPTMPDSVQSWYSPESLTANGTDTAGVYFYVADRYGRQIYDAVPSEVTVDVASDTSSVTPLGSAMYHPVDFSGDLGFMSMALTATTSRGLANVAVSSPHLNSDPPDFTIPVYGVKTADMLAYLMQQSTSPVLADLNGDGLDEAVVGSKDSSLHVLKADGTELEGWPQMLSTPVLNAAAIGDIDKDGAPEIVAAGGGPGWGGDVYAFEVDGTLVAGDWPQGLQEPTTVEASSSPALGDIDGDGYLEVVIGSSTMQVWAYEHDGSVTPGWPKGAMDPVFGTPGLGDVDGDGSLEIVAGDTAGFIWLWNGDGTPVSTWPAWPEFGRGGVSASPVLADMDSDGKQEIIVATKRYDVPGGYEMAMNEDATYLTGWDKYNSLTGFWASPAIGDLDGDGSPDILEAGLNARIYSYTLAGPMTPGWAVPTAGTGPSFDDPYLQSSPVLADINGDGSLEVVIGSCDSNLYAYSNQGVSLTGWPKALVSPTRATPAIGNMDGDDTWDIVVGSDDGAVYRFEVAGNTALKPADRFPWTSAHGDNRQSGSFKIVGWDTFTRSCWNNLWETMDFGGTWTHLNCTTGNPWTEPCIYVNGTDGCVEPGFGGLPAGVSLAGQSAADMNVSVKLGTSDFGGTCGLVARASSHNTFYVAVWSVSNAEFRLEKWANGVRTVLQSQPKDPGMISQMVRLRVEGNSIKARHWEVGTAEPAAWNLVAVDATPLPAGKAGCWVDSDEMLYFFDNFLAEVLCR